MFTATQEEERIPSQISFSKSLPTPHLFLCFLFHYVPLKYAHFGYHFFDFRWGEGACLRRPSFAFPEGLVTAQCFSEFLASLSGFLDLFGDLSRQ